MNNEQWPSEPINGSAPTLMELLASPSRIALHAKTLATEAAKLKQQGATVEAFQVPSDGRLGPFTLPGLAVMPDGSHRILFSFNGSWAEDDLSALLQWTCKVRSRAETERVPIMLLTEPGPAPEEAKEIVSTKPQSLISVLALPYLDPSNPVQNAVLMQHTLRHIGQGRFNLDANGARELDAYWMKEIGPLHEDAYFRNHLMMLIGAFIGQVAINSHGGEWASLDDQPEWMRFVRHREYNLSPMGRASKFLRDPGGQSLVQFVESSNPRNMSRIQEELKKRG